MSCSTFDVRDYASIQSAIDAAGAAGGGEVCLPPGTYELTSPLTVGNAVPGTSYSTYNGVRLVGQGRGSMGGVGQPPTKLRWAGPSSGTAVKINGPISNWGLHGICIDGGAGCERGLNVVCGQFGTVSDLMVMGCNQGLYEETLPYFGSGTPNTMHNRFSGLSIFMPTTNNAHSIYLDGNSADNITNTCFELFEDLMITFPTTTNTLYGIYLKKSDSNRFFGIQMTGSSNQKAVTFDYTGNAGWPADSVLEMVELGSLTAVVQNLGTPSGATLNRIREVSATNGRPADPRIANLSMGNVNYGVTTIGWPGGSVFGNFVTVAHGLGATPSSVMATCAGGMGLSQDPLVGAFNAGPMTFQLRGETIDAQKPLSTALHNVYWVAYG